MKYVRVQLDNGALATISEDLAVIADLTPLDEAEHPALDAYGKPIPDEFPVPDENDHASLSIFHDDAVGAGDTPSDS